MLVCEKMPKRKIISVFECCNVFLTKTYFDMIFQFMIFWRLSRSKILCFKDSGDNVQFGVLKNFPTPDSLELSGWRSTWCFTGCLNSKFCGICSNLKDTILF